MTLEAPPRFEIFKDAIEMRRHEFHYAMLGRHAAEPSAKMSSMLDARPRPPARDSIIADCRLRAMRPATTR